MNVPEVIIARCPDCGSAWEVGSTRCWLCYGDKGNGGQSESGQAVILATVVDSRESRFEGILTQIAILAAGVLVAVIGYGVFALQQVALGVIYVVAVLPPYLVVLFGSLEALIQGRPWSGKTAVATGATTFLAMLGVVAGLVAVGALVCAALFIALMVMCGMGR